MQDFKKIRLEKGITQIELARRVGVSINTIIKWENEISRPNKENYQKLLKALEILPFTEE